MNFGWSAVGGANEKESFQIMDRFVELGGNFFDTADVEYMYAN